jgi:hypothetical protein
MAQQRLEDFIGSIFRNNKGSNHGDQARPKTNCQINWQA